MSPSPSNVETLSKHLIQVQFDGSVFCSGGYQFCDFVSAQEVISFVICDVDLSYALILVTTFDFSIAVSTQINTCSNTS